MSLFASTLKIEGMPFYFGPLFLSYSMYFVYAVAYKGKIAVPSTNMISLHIGRMHICLIQRSIGEKWDPFYSFTNECCALVYTDIVRWYFLPRRASIEVYNDVLDESRGSNIVISTNEVFADIDVRVPMM
jgi:hypothetical protein